MLNKKSFRLWPILLLLAHSFLLYFYPRTKHEVDRTRYQVTDALAILHWLRFPERVNFKLALMAYRVLHGMAPPYLNQLVPVSNLPSHRRVGSSSTLQLLVPPYCLSTIGRRSFPVAASIIWNTLPHNVQSPSISTFRHLLKTFLFHQSFHGIIF